MDSSICIIYRWKTIKFRLPLIKRYSINLSADISNLNHFFNNVPILNAKLQLCRVFVTYYAFLNIYLELATKAGKLKWPSLLSPGTSTQTTCRVTVACVGSQVSSAVVQHGLGTKPCVPTPGAWGESHCVDSGKASWPAVRALLQWDVWMWRITTLLQRMLAHCGQQSWQCTDDGAHNHFSVSNVMFTPNGSLLLCRPDANWIHCFIFQLVRFVFIKANLKQTLKL